MKERRRRERITPPDTLYGTVRATVPAKVVDISPDGAKVEVQAPLRPAVDCDISLPTRRGEMRVRARVVRCRAGSPTSEGGIVYTAGLQFVHLSKEAETALEETYGASEPDNVVTPKKKKRGKGRIKIRVNPDDILRRLDEVG